MPSRARPVEVVVEVGLKRVFATATEWPGWSRSGRGEEAALEALEAYAERYAPVAAAAGQSLALPVVLTVVEHVQGDATTDFGAPGAVSGADVRRVTAADATRLAALVQASWATLDAVAATAPAELTKGPRGGGRDRDTMVAHVVSAESAYARRIGLRLREPAPGDRAAWLANRAAILAALSKPSDGRRLVEPKGWPLRYAAQRIAWHALDHAWEMQDRTPR